jgi:hypothetical protein
MTHPEVGRFADVSSPPFGAHRFRLRSGSVYGVIVSPFAQSFARTGAGAVAVWVSDVTVCGCVTVALPHDPEQASTNE